MFASIAAAVLQIVVVDGAAERHAACIAAIAEDGEAAYEDALAWRHQGGGWPAEHCVSLALIALDHPGPGAARLRAAAEGAVSATDMSRAIMFGQAGDGFLTAEEPQMAYDAFVRGLAFAPEDAGLRRGAAEAALELGDMEAAEAAASLALDVAQDPAEQVRALIVRAQARLENGALDAAAADVSAARRLAPENIDLLLLRGRINEARRGADWRQPG